MNRTSGRCEPTLARSEDVFAYVPLPPRDLKISIDDRITELLQAPAHALARLDLAGEIVSSLDWFIYAFVRKEAMISIQIQSTRATLINLPTFEAEIKPVPDTESEEICNYLEALTSVSVLVVMTCRKHDCSFAYQSYIDRPRAGTELERKW